RQVRGGTLERSVAVAEQDVDVVALSRGTEEAGVTGTIDDVETAVVVVIGKDGRVGPGNGGVSGGPVGRAIAAAIHRDDELVGDVFVDEVHLSVAIQVARGVSPNLIGSGARGQKLAIVKRSIAGTEQNANVSADGDVRVAVAVEVGDGDSVA